jgi:anti-sigma-K factor RskA
MSGGEDIEMLAAEYALGTLDAEERRAVERRLSTDPDLRRAVDAWEARLAPLAGAAPEVAPPAGLRDRVLARIPDGSDATGPAADVVDLTRRLRRWQRISGAAMALAASLVLVIGVREATRQPQTEFVGVFHPNDETPAFLLTIDLHARAVTIRPVAAPPPSWCTTLHRRRSVATGPTATARERGAGGAGGREGIGGAPSSASVLAR